MKYNIEVYDDYAIIKGWLTTSILKALIRLCKEEGFTHIKSFEGGFKLVRKDNA